MTSRLTASPHLNRNILRKSKFIGNIFTNHAESTCVQHKSVVAAGVVDSSFNKDYVTAQLERDNRFFIRPDMGRASPDQGDCMKCGATGKSYRGK